MRKIIKKNKKEFFICLLTWGIVFASAILLQCLIPIQFGFGFFDAYVAQISLTFITISVLSIFSDTSRVVYWENIVTKRLVEPLFTSFKAYFSYSFLLLLFSSFCFFAGLKNAFTVFFVTNIFCLFLLTKAMLNCYYGENKIKKELKDNLINDIRYLNKLKPSEMPEEKIEEISDTLERFAYNTGAI